MYVEQLQSVALPYPPCGPETHLLTKHFARTSMERSNSPRSTILFFLLWKEGISYIFIYTFSAHVTNYVVLKKIKLLIICLSVPLVIINPPKTMKINSANEPKVFAMTMFLASPPINRKRAPAFWFTPTKARYCLNIL